MADTYYSSLDSEVFDDQIVPDTDDCFLPPSEAPLPNGSWNLNVSYIHFIISVESCNQTYFEISIFMKIYLTFDIILLFISFFCFFFLSDLESFISFLII